VTGLYVGTLPVGAAHLLMRTLTARRVEIERQNLRLQKMNVELARSERMAAIGQMSSAISHQILQKVGLIGLHCDLLRDVLQDTTVPPSTVVSELHTKVEQLDTTISDLNVTLADLLVFSRDFALHIDSCDLAALVYEAVEEIRSSADARGVEIVYLCEDGRGEEALQLDQIKLKQALLNIVTTALEASPSPGRVEVVLRRQTESVQVAVVDHGPGITETDIEQVFTPFFSTKKQGSGLGLTFARKIVELHHGTLTAMNNPSGGATFLMELPVMRVWNKG
jgi:signal transduction histidine kinase